MGNSCSQIEQQTDQQYEIKSPLPQQSYSVKLNLPAMQELKLNKINGDDNRTVVEITTDRERLQESQKDSQRESMQQSSQGSQSGQFLQKRFQDETMTINKSHKFVISGMDDDIVKNLEDIGALQKSSILDNEKPQNEEEDYDLLYQVDYDNIKFNTPSVMKQVDYNKQTSIKQKQKIAKYTQ